MKALERRLLALYYGASPQELQEGLDWYKNAHEACDAIGRGYGIPVEKVAGVVAALSPGLQWKLNLEQAEYFIRHVQAGASMDDACALPVGVYGKGNRRKAYRILKSDGAFETVLGLLGKRGPKTRAFFTNIANPYSYGAVTIDRHAKGAAYNIIENRDKLTIVKESEYLTLQKVYQNVAARIGILPHQLQAVVWVVWRNNLQDLER